MYTYKIGTVGSAEMKVKVFGSYAKHSGLKTNTEHFPENTALIVKYIGGCWDLLVFSDGRQGIKTTRSTIECVKINYVHVFEMLGQSPDLMLNQNL